MVDNGLSKEELEVVLLKYKTFSVVSFIRNFGTLLLGVASHSGDCSTRVMFS